MSPSIIGWRGYGEGMCGVGVWIGCVEIGYGKRVCGEGVWRGDVEIVCR